MGCKQSTLSKHSVEEEKFTEYYNKNTLRKELSRYSNDGYILDVKKQKDNYRSKNLQQYNCSETQIYETHKSHIAIPLTSIDDKPDDRSVRFIDDKPDDRSVRFIDDKPTRSCAATLAKECFCADHVTQTEIQEEIFETTNLSLYSVDCVTHYSGPELEVSGENVSPLYMKTYKQLESAKNKEQYMNNMWTKLHDWVVQLSPKKRNNVMISLRDPAIPNNLIGFNDVESQILVAILEVFPSDINSNSDKKDFIDDDTYNADNEESSEILPPAYDDKPDDMSGRFINDKPDDMSGRFINDNASL